MTLVDLTKLLGQGSWTQSHKHLEKIWATKKCSENLKQCGYVVFKIDCFVLNFIAFSRQRVEGIEEEREEEDKKNDYKKNI